VRPKVLIVDDDAPLLAALKRLLKPSFDVAAFADGEEASRYVSTSTFDLAVLDVVLPRFDGWSLLEQCRRERPGVPVVMLSGKTSPDVVVNAMKRGACDFVPKPLENARSLPGRLSAALTSAAPRLEQLQHELESDAFPLPRYSDARRSMLNEFQRTYLERLMREAGGNLSAASRLSGIDRANLRRALQKYKKQR
jgi:DNA-binding NtrC family response regulator